MKKYVDIHSFAKDNMKAYHTENGVEFAVPMKAINEAPATDSDILVWHNLRSRFAVLRFADGTRECFRPEEMK